MSVELKNNNYFHYLKIYKTDYTLNSFIIKKLFILNHMMTNNQNLWDAVDSTQNTSADRNSFAHAHSSGPRTLTSVTTGALCLA